MKKKKITEKNKIFVKIIHIFYLKNIIIFRLVLLHLNNHTRGVLKKKCSENMQQIYRRTPMLKCDINKIALQLY